MKTIIKIGFATALGSILGFLCVGAGFLLIFVLFGNAVLFVDKGIFVSWDRYAEVMPMILRASYVGALAGPLFMWCELD